MSEASVLYTLHGAALNHTYTERHSIVINMLVLYLERPGFEFRPADRLSQLKLPFLHSILKQEVLERASRQLSLIRHGPH
jgi:ectoine hydroxylase-related dioxygenase (phytanoyl-CoA dioxygenase family)